MRVAAAESLARRLGFSEELRQTMSRKFRRSRVEAIEERNQALSPPTFLDLQTPGGLGGSANPIRAMLKDLGIVRFLTLNYDVEIEREFRRIFRTTGARQAFSNSESSEFEKLCAPDDNRCPDRVEYIDGMRRSVLSVCMNRDNIGELINFALHPASFDAQVFHLHGRCDQPESLVLTEEDYQATYLQPDEQSDTFEEALSAIFSGNDVLFVGVGMSEADMLRPLRQFVSKDSSPDFAKRHVYAFIENQTTLDLDYSDADRLNTLKTHYNDRVALEYVESVIKFPDPDNKTKDQENETTNPVNTQANFKDRIADNSRALNLRAQYGVFAIYYGGQVLRDYRLFAMIAATPKQNKQWLAALIAQTERMVDLCEMTDGLLKTPDEVREQKEVFQALTKTLEGKWKRGNYKLNTKQQEQLKTYAQALQTEMWSRALERALTDLAGERDQWWSDWRQPPRQRRARYPALYCPHDANKPKDAKRPLFVRHRTLHASDGNPDDYDVKMLKWMKEQAIEADVVARLSQPDGTGPRILRMQVPRGGGKGALLNILRQSDENGLFIYNSIFPDGNSKGELQRHHSAFFVHLSFSMEFSSVIEALRRFFKDALIGLIEDSADEIEVALARTSVTDEPPIVQFLRKWHKDHPGNPFLNASEPIDAWLEEDPGHSYGTFQHRVDRLRYFMSRYADLANWLDSSTGSYSRVFVYLSGLDLLCAANGEARNPMFRAFFRLMTGCGAKRVGEHVAKLPMDLVLVAGTMDPPIHYLSHEILVEKHDQEHKDPQQRQLAAHGFHYVKDREILLKRWPTAPRLDLKERYWLVKMGEKSSRDFCLFVRDELLRSVQERKYSRLRGSLANSVAMSTWVFGAIASLRVPATNSERERTAQKVFAEFDAAGARAGDPGIIDLAYTMMRDNVAIDNGVAWDRIKAVYSEEVPSSPRHFTIDTHFNNEQRIARRKDLIDLVLHHLTLFPMPVELRVLYGCDEIYARLKGDIRRKWREYHFPKGTSISPDKQLEARKKLRGNTRKAHLMELRDLLKVLVDRGFVLKVAPKSHTYDYNAVKDLDEGDETKLSTDDALVRYTVHARLREYLGHRMRLAVPDQGERNYFQVSLFSDQPRDIPTPTQDHYRMFRQIIDRQIRNVQNTLWCFYQLQDLRSGLELPEHNLELAEAGLSRRLTKAEGGVDETFASINAVPQRIRALYGLLRSGFSIGAISRLISFEDEANPDLPYERFRGWLRDVTNAAVGMHHTYDELLNVTGYKRSKKYDQYSRPARKGVDRHTVDFPEFSEMTSIELPVSTPLSQPLYRDEIGWLYNERGVISLVQGHLFDAIPLFEQALLVMRHGESDASGDPALHAATRRITLNLAVAQIERGNLFRARQMIEGLRLPDDFNTHAGSVVNWLCDGYLGLIDHLSGHIEPAIERYKTVIERADSRQMLRAVSIFNRHLGDLYRRMGDESEAIKRINLAISAAMQSEQRDILHMARLSLVYALHCQENGESEEVLQYTHRCLRYARRMGAPRLETMALKLQAQLMLQRGERVLAGRVATEAAGLSSRIGMRLHKLSALSVYADALEKRQQFGLARQVLSEARGEAENRGYQTLAGELSDKIARLP